MTKSKKLLIILPIALLVITLIIVSIVFSTRLIGLTTRKDIRVSAYHNSKVITLPVKMVKGVYSPSVSYFNSDLDVQALCDTVKDTYIVEIVGSNAIIKDKTQPKLVHAQLVNVSSIPSTTFKYVLIDGGVKINDTIILMPLYMLDEFNFMQPFEGQDKVSAPLHESATWEKIKDFYAIENYYQVDKVDDDTIKVTGLMAQHSEVFTVTYNKTNRLLNFTITS